MTAPITSTTPTSTGTPDPLSAAVAGGTMDKNAFMKLLVAQMTHQDPLAPSDGTQMATQLAQFSSVEQLMNISNELGSQSTSNSALVNAVNNSAAIGLIGKTVTAQSDQIAVGTNPTTSVSTNLQGAGHLTLNITDSTGATVATKDLGSVSGGMQTVPLDSLTKGLASGTYHVTFNLADATGKITNPPALVTAKIDGINYGATGAVLTSGALTFPVGTIVSVNAGN
ncbi:MAG: flagellar hook assembly protein FlgD [Gemmatimonadales bacterium]